MAMEKEQKIAYRIMGWAFIACIFVCIPFLKNPTLFDDFNIITPSKLEELKDIGPSLSPRIWVYQTFLLNQNFFGSNLEGYRITNLIIHLANSLALFFLCKEARNQTAIKNSTTPKKHNLDAALVAALFAVHPIAILTQAYLVQRTVLLATCFALCSTIFFLRGLRGSKLSFYLSTFFCLMSLYSKENAIALPGVLFLLSMAEARAQNLRAMVFFNTRKHASFSLFICSLIAFSIALRLKGLIGSNYEPLTSEIIEDNPLLEGKNIYLLSVLNQAKLFFTYLAYWTAPLPENLSIDIRKPFPTQFFSTSAWLPAIPFFLYILFFAAQTIREKITTLQVFMVAPGVLFLTEFAATRLQEIFVLYRSYLWIPFGLVAISLILEKLKSAKLKIASLFFLSIMLLYSSCATLVPLTNAYLAWDAARKIYEKNSGEPFTPGGYRIYYNIGTTLYDQRNLELALENYNKSLELNSKYSHALLNRGVIYLDTQNWELALHDFEDAYSLNKSSIKPLIGKAKALNKLGKKIEFEETVRELCSLSNESTCREAKTFATTE
jgi:tetratricopeptide (TPR) repeat protein